MTQTLQKTIRLHRAQRDYRLSPALYRGFVGGRGAGKTWCGCYDLLRRAKPGRTYMVASPTGVVMKDTTFPTFKTMAQELGLWRSATMSPWPNVKLARNVTVRFRTAEDPEMMRGPNLSGVWLDEASLMHEDAYRICIASLREAGEQGWLGATFTPKGLTHWTYQRFGKQQPDTELFHARTADNPFNPPGFANNLAKQYVGRFALQELKGEFVSMDGAEWPGEYFDSPELYFDQWPADVLFRVMALDPSKGKTEKAMRPVGAPKIKRSADQWEGDYSAFAMVALTADGVLWVDADLDNRRDVVQIVEDGIRLFRGFNPQALVLEVNGFQSMFAAEFERLATPLRLHLPLYGITNTVSKVERIRTLGSYLAQRKLRFKRGSPGTEMLVNQLRDFPVGAHDDGPDSLEMGIRMLLYLLGQTTQRDGPVLLSVRS